jgi:hypothetical protein
MTNVRRPVITMTLTISNCGLSTFLFASSVRGGIIGFYMKNDTKFYFQNDLIHILNLPDVLDSIIFTFFKDHISAYELIHYTLISYSIFKMTSPVGLALPLFYIPLLE